MLEDRLIILLGGPFAISIPFSNIKEVKPAMGSETFVYWGIRFMTSTNYVVGIVRKNGLDLVISPNHGDTFLIQLNQAHKLQSN